MKTMSMTRSINTHEDNFQFFDHILTNAAQNSPLTEFLLKDCTISFDEFSRVFDNSLGLTDLHLGGSRIAQAEGFTQHSLTNVVMENTTI